MTRISVLGGTGYSGSAVVAEAARRGHDVTAISRRDPDKRADGVTYVKGSVLDFSVLEAVVRDHDVVIEAVSPRGDMAGHVENVVDQLIGLVANTSTRLGVIGGASSLLIHEGGPRFYDVTDIPDDVRPEIDTGLALLKALKNSPEDVDWFYVSPPLEYGSWAPAPDTGTYRLSDDVLLKDSEGNSAISSADLARAIIDEIEQPQYRRRRFHAAH